MPPASSDLGPWREPVLEFRRLVEAAELHGLLFQHYDLCRRRAWLHLNRIDYAHLDARMTMGAVAHELHRPRDRSVRGLMGLAPDRIDWDAREVVEAKGSAGARRAVSRQTAFYALLLMAATGQRWTASNEIIGRKRRLAVSIDDEVVGTMLTMARELAQLLREDAAPPAERQPICATCSYRHLCWGL